MTAARLVVLASGGGRTLENLEDHILQNRLHAQIKLVIVSAEELGAVTRAKRLGLPYLVISRSTHADVHERRQAIREAIDDAQPDWIVMAGWLQLLPIPSHWEGKVLNIHPALLPAYGGKGFYGHHVHEAVARDRQQVSGCTVHFATEQYDEGPILLQEAVPLPDGTTSDEIASLVFEAEKRAYPEALQALISGRASWRDGEVTWSA
jgi:phosphoribosylglycinamide formyltransferase 1